MKLKGSILSFILFFTAGAVMSASGPGGAGPFGLGVMVGAPTGLTGKYFLNDRRAIQVGVGWDLDDDADITADYLVHTRRAFSSAEPPVADSLGYYVGAGVRGRTESDDALGIRGIGGLSWLFPNHPFEIFVELAPTLVLIDDADGDLDGGLGIRYYFQ